MNKKVNNILNKNYIYRNFDVIIGVASLIFGASIVYVSIGLREIYQEDLGTIVVLSSLFYLYFKKNIIKKRTISIHISNTIKICNNILFAISILVSMWIVWNSLYYRPATFFIFITIAAASIIFEIFYTENAKKHYFILIKILVLSLIVRASLYYEFSGIYGVDPWIHNELIKATIATGHVVKGTHFRSNSYYEFPIYHIACAIVHIVSSLNIYNGIFLSMGFIASMSSIFVFFIGTKIADSRVGLLSALVLNLSEYSILWGINIMPMSLGFFFVSIIMYIILCKNGLNYKYLMMILSYSLILTHTIATIIMYLIITVTVAVNNLYSRIENTKAKNQMIVSIGFLTLFSVVMIQMWMKTSPIESRSFFETIMRGLIYSISNDAELVVHRPTNIAEIDTPYINTVLSHLGYYLLLGLGLIGSLIWLNIKNRDLHKITLVSIVLMFIICIYSFIIVSLNNILPDRWFSFMYIPLLVIGMQGLINMTNIFRKDTSRVLSIVFVIITIIFMMTTNSLVNPDNPLYPQESAIRLGYTQSELAAVVSISQMQVRPITDLYYALIFPYVIGDENYDNMSLSKSQIIVIRNYNLHNPSHNDEYRASLHYGRSYYDYEQYGHIRISDYLSEIGIDKKPLIYNNGNVNAYSIM